MAVHEWRLRIEARPVEETASVTVKSLVVGFLLVIGITIAGCYSAFLRYDLIGTGHLPPLRFDPRDVFSPPKSGLASVLG